MFAFRVVLFIINRFFDEKDILRLFSFLVDAKGLDLLKIAYNKIGILKYQSPKLSGETYLMDTILKSQLASKAKPVLFDVGANVGNYTQELTETFPEASIYAFEPNNHTYAELKKYQNLRVHCINSGLGSEEKMNIMYSYANDLNSEHATLYKDVLTDLHGTKTVQEINFHITSLDKFSILNNLEFIDFLKIDTEGHELEVLKGAKEMLSKNKIGIIQFEFNEMNVVSRVFLKDFYSFLSNYFIYRLDSERLIPLFSYSSSNEIFQFQNFVAFNKAIYPSGSPVK